MPLQNPNPMGTTGIHFAPTFSYTQPTRQVISSPKTERVLGEGMYTCYYKDYVFIVSVICV